MVMKAATPLNPTAHERNSIFECKQPIVHVLREAISVAMGKFNKKNNVVLIEQYPSYFWWDLEKNDMRNQLGVYWKHPAL